MDLSGQSCVVTGASVGMAAHLPLRSEATELPLPS